MKSDYETLAKEWDALTEAYEKRLGNIGENGTPMMWEGSPTTVELYSEWKKHRSNLAVLFEKHGWTEEEFENVIIRIIERYS